MNRIDLAGHVAVVTGAARGIGYAIAERLLQSGAAVALWDIDAEALERAERALGVHGMVAARVVDVTDESSVKEASADAVARFGFVDLLANNAGIGGPICQTWEYDAAIVRRVFEVNYMGTFLCCKHLVPVMKQRNYGRIVNIASIAGKNGSPNFSAYGASKAAVIGLTKALGRELADTEIIVNALCPSVADTDILQQFTPEKVRFLLEQVPKGRFVYTSEIAAMVAWLCSEECSFSTGQLFDITGGRSVY
ncbi:MAG: SDR family oxidoreductase [Burkholderiales bacterium]|nr:SDR family oxidoreductase [Burkholderiales bacterium]